MSDSSVEPPRFPWPELLQRWKSEGYGESGLTLPFIVGALVRLGVLESSLAGARELVDDIRLRPAADMAVFVHQCPDVRAPVLEGYSVRGLYRPPAAVLEWPHSGGDHYAIGFSKNLVDRWGAKNVDDALEKLLEDASQPILAKKYSRSGAFGGEQKYGPFVAGEVLFIDSVLRSAE